MVSPGDGMDEGMQLTSDLCETMLRTRGPAERISYREAFERYVGIDPHAADGGRRWPRRPGRAASSRRRASPRTTATAGSIC